MMIKHNIYLDIYFLLLSSQMPIVLGKEKRFLIFNCPKCSFRLGYEENELQIVEYSINSIKYKGFICYCANCNFKINGKISDKDWLSDTVFAEYCNLYKNKKYINFRSNNDDDIIRSDKKRIYEIRYETKEIILKDECEPIHERNPILSIKSLDNIDFSIIINGYNSIGIFKGELIAEDILKKLRSNNQDPLPQELYGIDKVKDYRIKTLSNLDPEFRYKVLPGSLDIYIKVLKKLDKPSKFTITMPIIYWKDDNEARMLFID